MKIYIDFSIFESPIRAYSNVTGYLELSAKPKIGDKVQICEFNVSEFIQGFSGSLEVKTIAPIEGYGEENTVFGLEDVVVTSIEEARKLAKILENECHLSCIEY